MLFFFHTVTTPSLFELFDQRQCSYWAFYRNIWTLNSTDILQWAKVKEKLGNKTTRLSLANHFDTAAKKWPKKIQTMNENIQLMQRRTGIIQILPSWPRTKDGEPFFQRFSIHFFLFFFPLLWTTISGTRQKLLQTWRMQNTRVIKVCQTDSPVEKHFLLSVCILCRSVVEKWRQLHKEKAIKNIAQRLFFFCLLVNNQESLELILMKLN